ncbi:hypothetical protein dsat_1377 [Alkalidesulfovibrio alkalitolerans DSM 16529]|jgi:TolB-like protein|uniref:FlgO domain-containing protein n=1 Tax=Alkalidesulfovibrio alkalitolerans DSM 16529 TaxID=1121439 RepID=S7T2B1_9BACT|nr:FlgO family outer membrane protein [Alkalidesulfovibrio alkalitolerans]EPR30655.1 hypothetical protein dsat_1377 [Alkalidesulfovibrio alkalitolerans DSM 16529]
MPNVHRICAVFAGIVLLAALTAGCSVQTLEDFHAAAQRMNPKKSPCETTGCVLAANMQAADTLDRALQSRKFPKSGRIVLTTFVDVDNLAETSTLGRLIPEQISARLAQKGYSAVELKTLSPDIAIQNDVGEFALSRQTGEVVKTGLGDAILIGTYAMGAASIAVTVRVIDADDNVVLAGAGYELPLSPDVMTLAQIAPAQRSAGTGPADLRPVVSTLLPGDRR